MAGFDGATYRACFVIYQALSHRKDGFWGAAEKIGCPAMINAASRLWCGFRRTIRVVVGLGLGGVEIAQGLADRWMAFAFPQI